MKMTIEKVHGWLVVDKPLGVTSARAINAVKRLFPKQKIGHAGTLDPLASGVLPLAIGEATKVMPYVVDWGKTYTFTVTWGEERTTDDREGEVTAQSDLRPTKEEIEAILSSYQGDIFQVPPAYSAIKIEGQRAYARARRGEQVEMKSRPVFVKSLTLESFSANEASFKMECGKGTYVRSIARDLGRDHQVFRVCISLEARSGR